MSGSLVTLASGEVAMRVVGYGAPSAESSDAPSEAPSASATVAVTSVVTASLATSKVIKASAGNLYGLNCAATTVAGMFLLHNATSAPAAGAVTPIKVYPVGIGQAIDITFDPPIRCGTGISVTFTTAATPFTQTDSATAFISGDAV